MMTLEVFVTGRALTAEAERDLGDRVLRALTTEDAAPDAAMEGMREFVHVLVAQPRTWATGGPTPDAAPRYLVRLTVPGSWSDREFGAHVVPLITEAVAATEPDPTRLLREPHCIVQVIGLREHCIGTLGATTTSTEMTRLMTQGYRDSGERRVAPAGSTIDPVCGMPVEWDAARFTITHDGVAHAFCAPSCRKVYAEDHGLT
ncbi:ATPase [Pseudonocardia sp. MH-G8]|uniref:ATPase n=1 Tax=Pseudonocardia sp. MH-G8 TaxID=1854588 RepID=UPI000BA03AF4|nr:ATPase [Pseudonocardia sp. MH-G8]OZM81812.1 ATPase [Pseudonocardia sp. MH-G8]